MATTTAFRVRAALVVLGVAGISAAQCGPTSSGVYFLGADINFTYSADAGSCCAACIETPGCAAYSWLPPSDPSLASGHCHLKNRAGSGNATQPGAVSGVIAGVAPSVCLYFLTPCNMTGSCALFASDCDAAPPTCGPGSIICPGASTCVPPGSGFLACPALPAFYNATLPIAARVQAAVEALSLVQVRTRAGSCATLKEPLSRLLYMYCRSVRSSQIWDTGPPEQSSVLRASQPWDYRPITGSTRGCTVLRVLATRRPCHR